MSAPNEAQTKRIYPEMIPWEEGHPTTATFDIIDTEDQRGRGMRAKVPFAAGSLVAQLSGALVSRPSINTIQISSTLHMADPWFCRYLLHSCDPNLAIDTAVMRVRALRDIDSGEILTIDYAATEDVIANQFACKCGASNCRGWMTGRREGPNEEGRAFLAARERAGD